MYQWAKDTGHVTGDPDSEEFRESIEAVTCDALDQVTTTANVLYGADVYLASLFKNLTKCRAIVKEIRQE